MRLPTDPAKLKLLSSEYILKHCRALEKKLDTLKKQLQEMSKSYMKHQRAEVVLDKLLASMEKE